MMSIIDESDDSTTAATSYTDAFLDSAIAKVDATFGVGFARANPALLGAMIQASATNLNAFMSAASNLPMDMFSMMGDDESLTLPSKPKKKGR